MPCSGGKISCTYSPKTGSLKFLAAMTYAYVGALLIYVDRLCLRMRYTSWAAASQRGLRGTDSYFIYSEVSHLLEKDKWFFPQALHILGWFLFEPRSPMCLLHRNSRIKFKLILTCYWLRKWNSQIDGTEKIPRYGWFWH